MTGLAAAEAHTMCALLYEAQCAKGARLNAFRKRDALEAFAFAIEAMDSCVAARATPARACVRAHSRVNCVPGHVST